MESKLSSSNINNSKSKEQMMGCDIELPMITIITVVRNCQDTIEKTILSVLNQDYRNTEYIIIDGASTDNTLEIIKKYNNKIDFWTSEPDMGIYDAMNKGIEYAHGEYVNFLNAGDVFADNNILDKIVNQYRMEQSDVMYGDFIAFDTTNNLERVIKAKPISKIWEGMVSSHQSVFIKKVILEKNKFNIKYKLVADYEQFLRLMTNKYTVNQIDFPISKTSIDGISYSKIRTTIETIKVIQSINPYTLHILKFFPHLLLNTLKKLIGNKITTKIRVIKWKYIQNSNY